jgi:hypothetical protein
MRMERVITGFEAEYQQPTSAREGLKPNVNVANNAV